MKSSSNKNPSVIGNTNAHLIGLTDIVNTAIINGNFWNVEYKANSCNPFEYVSVDKKWSFEVNGKLRKIIFYGLDPTSYLDQLTVRSMLEGIKEKLNIN